MQVLQTRVNHKAFQRTNEYINASKENKAYLLSMTLRDKLKYELAKFIEQNMVTSTYTGSVYTGNPFLSDGEWEPEELTVTNVKFYLLTEEEYQKLQGD